MRFRYRLAVVSTHPIQYHAPWFRELAAHPDLRLHVYYCHEATPQEQARAGFGVAFDWDVPLLEGYPYTFLRNVAKPAGHGRFSGFDTPDIGNIIRGREYDAILVNGWNYKSAWQAIWAAWRSGVKVLVRGDSHLRSPRNLLLKLTKILAYRRFIPRFDACLAVGQWSREYFLYYGARPQRVFFVPHAVDNQRIAAECRRLDPTRGELRKQWGLDEKAIVFVFSGKFTAKKRPLDFVLAIDQAARKGVAVQGLMVGDGPLRPRCEEFVRAHDTPIRFTGFLNQSQIVSSYVASDVLVLPSDGRETWGLVVNEAMACGRPCIVSNKVGSGPDLVLQEKTGVVYPLGNIPILVASMLKLARNPPQIAVMGVYARDRLLSYSIGCAVKGVLQSLETAVGTKEPTCIH